MDAIKYYGKYISWYRATCVLFGLVVAFGIGIIKHRQNEIPYLYLLFDAIISTIVIPVAMPAGWRMTVLHVFASALWLFAAWRLILLLSL